MGISCSRQGIEQFTRFQKVGQLDIRHLGKVHLLYDQLTKIEVIRASYEFVLNRDQEEQFINKLKYNNNKCPYLINIHHIQIKPGTACCGINTYHVYFEYLPNTLKRILELASQPLPEEEVRLILGCLLEAVRDINDRETYHGDIYPEFIYIDDRGQRRYKIFDSTYFNPLKHGYYRAFEQASFCSPEVLANVSEGKTFPLFNFYISDTFSIGMVGLYAMTQIDPIIAYNNKTKEIDYYYIENMLRICSQRGYSEYLLCCVEDCVRLKDRPHASQLLECYPELQTSHSVKHSLRK